MQKLSIFSQSSSRQLAAASIFKLLISNETTHTPPSWGLLLSCLFTLRELKLLPMSILTESDRDFFTPQQRSEFERSVIDNIAAQGKYGHYHDNDTSNDDNNGGGGLLSFIFGSPTPKDNDNNSNSNNKKRRFELCEYIWDDLADSEGEDEGE